MTHQTCDVAVIGAGTAGIAAFRAAEAAGADAVLIERGPGGTTCARVGCMPSKLLVAAAAAAHDARRASLFGVAVSGVSVDGPAVMARVRAERDRFVAGVRDGLDAIPLAKRLAGEARFLDARTLALGDDRRVAFRAAVIATGSSPSIPKPLAPLGDAVLTTDTVFELPDLPASLAVIGGGPVGIEIAQAMARLGVRVDLFDTGSGLAGLSEPGLRKDAAAIFSDEMALHLGSELVSAEPVDGGAQLTWAEADGTRRTGTFARVLAAAGRPPNVRGLDLAQARLRLDEKGMPAFDTRTLLCAGAPVLIAGDANAVRPVLHEASRQGGIAGRNAAALAAGRALAAPEPWPALAMVFTHPQAASIGAPFDPEAGDGRVVGGMSFDDQGRARVEGVNRGGIRLWADRDGRLLGGEMLGPSCEHLAHLVAHAIGDGRTVDDLLARPIYHPTVEEGLASALSDLIQPLKG
ncbi:dihydrolipoyl dehydrogenase [Methylobacterium sp. WL30]|uniref:dihydrolipoyl dehydrogenase n=2 Tax=Methylobacterium TaxID=407 RepID=UPI0011CA8A88|nr:MULTISPECIES: dihydrolipoyl dehydrogenase [unclassified Methylobacterium]TXN52065.1 dihydrolipoyl dehydrogenase [Methylobacterium sp. WL119]TXN70401.1 dihydrolipoyl dehydrogenase [Methylobacterium sp. WL30]